MCIDILFISIEQLIDYFKWRFKICSHIIVIYLKRGFKTNQKKYNFF